MYKMFSNAFLTQIPAQINNNYLNVLDPTQNSYFRELITHEACSLQDKNIHRSPKAAKAIHPP